MVNWKGVSKRNELSNGNWFGRGRGWDKKGIENLEDVGMFFLVSLIVGLGVFAGLYIFYNVGGDVRLEEAKIMSLMLERGVLDGEYFREDILSSEYSIDSFMRDVGIDEGVLNSGGYFYFNVQVISGGNLVKEFEMGKGAFELECFLEGDSLPVCLDREIEVSSLDGEDYIIKILTGSNQLGEKL